LAASDQEREISMSRKRNKGLSLGDRPVEQPCAAGIDIGAREIFVAVHHDPDEEPVRRFGTFTEDLEQMADWLEHCGVTTVAMESTGVYWIPLYEILDRRGLQPCVVNARHMKNVPGRRTDWHECQWIQFLHSVGLLRAAFRPEDQVCAVRAILRHRQQLVEMAAQHVQHMQKSLPQMNLQIQHVISDITGLTGLAIIDAILAGERNPTELAKLRDPRIKTSRETVEKSLRGNWRQEHLFTLRQSLELCRSYQSQIVAAEQKIESVLDEFTPRADPEQKPLPADKKKNRSSAKRRRKVGHSTHFDVRTEAYKLFGVDVTQIPGLESNVLPLFGEVGRDMTRWPTAHHFVSWLALCPDNDISGAGYCGAACAKPIIAPARSSAWRPSLCIAVRPRSAITSAASKPSLVRLAPSPPQPERSPPSFTPSSAGKWSLTTPCGKSARPNANNGCNVNLPARPAASATSWFPSALPREPQMVENRRMRKWFLKRYPPHPMLNSARVSARLTISSQFLSDQSRKFLLPPK
jgi:transposase